MKFGLIGRGYWGDVYRKTIEGLGHEAAFFDRGEGPPDPDGLMQGLIIATSGPSHYEIAKAWMRHVPVIIEKPMTMNVFEARHLKLIGQKRGGIVFTGHTHLYSPVWRALKAKHQGTVESVYAQAGGPCKLPPKWDWGPHLVALCYDIGFDPHKADLRWSFEDTPFKFVVNGRYEYLSPMTYPTPLEVLITEFAQAIEKGEPDIRGLELGVKVVEFLDGRN